MKTEAPDTLDREQRLNIILLEYVEALEQGETPNRYDLLAAHPDLAPELLEFFKSRDQVDRLTAPLREAVRAAESELGTLGDFRLLREVGRGGMGVVYEAEQISLRRRVALKVLPFAAAMDPRQLQRFRNEAQAAAHLHHTNIVPVFAVGAERGVHYYAMQFIEGQSLAALLDDLRRGAGRDRLPDRAALLQQPVVARSPDRATPPTPVVARSPDRATPLTEGLPKPVETFGQAPWHGQETVPQQNMPQQSQQRQITANSPTATTQIAAAMSTERVAGKHYFQRVAGLIRQAAEALEHAHQMGVVHRDIKPANLLLDRRGDLWITDFGLAQFRSDAGLTLTGELLGTLRYASPEQSLAKRGLVDHRTDIYSLGVTLYELLTLTPVFGGRDRQELLHQIAFEEPRPPRALDATIPVELETIVLKAIAKTPPERYASARDFADDLQRFLDDKPILARRPSLLDRATKWGRRHPSVVIASVVVLILLSIASVICAAVVFGEQAKTEAAYKEAEKAANSERRRADEAEARFHLARRSVDELFRVSEQELADRPGMERLRKRVLESVLVYYREFIELRRDDPQAQTELRETEARVEKIVADLVVLQGAWNLDLLSQPDVLDDLRVNDEQRAKVKELKAQLDKQRKDSFANFDRLPPEERRQRFLEQARANDAEVRQILRTEQRARLPQIALQLQGPSAFREADVAAALKLTPEQRERIRGIDEDWFFAGMQEMMRPGKPPGDPRKGNEPKRKQEAVEHILALLTDEQAQRWKEMTGEPFKGTAMFWPGPPGPPPPPR